MWFERSQHHVHLEDGRRHALRVVHCLSGLDRGAREAILDAALDAEGVGVQELARERGPRRPTIDALRLH
jgi:hypothetical protein